MPRRKRTFIFTRYPPAFHFTVAYDKRLNSSAVQLYFALLFLAFRERFIDSALLNYLKSEFSFSSHTLYRSYNALLSFGYVRERKGKEFVEVELVPEGTTVERKS